MNRKWMSAAALLVLMLSVCVFALAEEPTDPVYPVPGPLEKHEHTISVKIIGRGYTAHRLQEWCPDCGRLLKERLESHNFVDGVCTVCDWECPHPPEAAEKHYERDGVKPQWDGNYIICPGWEITECGVCHTVLSRVETTVREFHNVHTHFTPVLECLPHDADTHALIRICDECGTEVPEYVPHNCPPSDRPYTDEGDPDTHSRLVRCADCGFWVPQQQPHTWVHDSYKKDEMDGGEEGHIEVMKCSVCGAKKEVRRPHGAGTHVAYRQSGNADTHIEVLQCPLCNETFETERPHELIRVSCRNDGDTSTHIEVLVCTLCEAEAEKRVAHKPMHLYWKRVSDTQDQETVRCNICGLTYTCAPVAHTFDTYTYVSDGAGSANHTKYAACSKCGMRTSTGVKEAHTWSLGGDHWGDYCKKCNAAGWHEHFTSADASPSGFRAVDENNHVELWFCRSCFARYEGSSCAHSFDPATMKCTGCGYLKEGCEHSITYKPVSSEITAEQHTVIGTCNKCGKQITLTGAHDMQFVSRSAYEPCENGHTYIDTYRCSYCGYETEEEISEEHTIWTVAECIDNMTHMEKCELCSYTGPAAHSFVNSPIPDECLWCKYCGFDMEHILRVVSRKAYPDYHDLTCECVRCHKQIEVKNAPHKDTRIYQISSADEHHLRCICEVCWHESQNTYQSHNFDAQGVCTDCGYHKGDPVSETSLTIESLFDNNGKATGYVYAFCQLTAGGEEISCSYVLAQSEDGEVADLFLLPESISGDAVIEIRFTAPELELLQSFGIKSVYIRLSDADLLLLSDIGQVSDALAGQERDELIITLIPGSDGACTVQYDPAGVCITE